MLRAAVESLFLYLLLSPASDATESPVQMPQRERFKVIPWHSVEGGGGGGDGGGGNAMLAVVVMRGGMP